MSEQPISGTSRSAHRSTANRNLMNDMTQNPDLANSLNKELGADVVNHMNSGKGALKNPPGTQWHHPKENPSVMQLLKTDEHQNSFLQEILHGGGTGGYADHFGG